MIASRYVGRSRAAEIRRTIEVTQGRWLRAARRAELNGRPAEAGRARRHIELLEEARLLVGGRRRRGSS